MSYLNQILLGDSRQKLKELPDNSVDCIITSPPYYALRDYKHDNQLGQEKTVNEYVDNLVSIFDECKRVLAKDGTCWIVIGDTFAGHKGDLYDNINPKLQMKRHKTHKQRMLTVDNIGYKSLCMIPERFAIKMIDRGWILRNKIIWKKMNVMPSSAKDRFTIDYEFIYFFTKSRKYYFKTQYEPLSFDSIKRDQRGRNGNSKTSTSPYSQGLHKPKENNKVMTNIKFGGNKADGYGNPVYSGKSWNYDPNIGRIKRSVWTINTSNFSDVHYAVFPENLVFQCLKAGCKPNGTILDPFMGSGTTALVALKNNRKFVGVELNPDYRNIALKRINPYLQQTKLEVFIKQ